jgi:hypothetical protein
MTEDKKLLELYGKCKYDTAIELGGRTITTQSLLEAQSRISFRAGVEAEIKQIKATHETDTVWKLVTIKNVRSLITPPKQ